jgi:hypothetical protein
LILGEGVGGEWVLGDENNIPGFEGAGGLKKV